LDGLQNFAGIDFLIVLAYFGAVLWIGRANKNRNRNAEDFITAGRSMPWLAVLGSLVATEVSAATFLATPGTGFSEDMSYLQFGIGSFLARIFIALVFVGAFYSMRYLTIYEFLAHRFGNGTRYTSTLFFIATRLLASAVRLMIAATGVSLILGVDFWICLSVFTLIAALYSGSGGIRGIIWTDILQATVFIACGLILLAFLGAELGWSTIIDTGKAAGRFEVFRLTPGTDASGAPIPWLEDAKLLPVAVIFGFLATAAAFGTDQDMTQRMLTCKNARAARRSVILSGFIAIPIAALFLLVGIALFAFYEIHGAAELPQAADGSVNPDKAFPWFIRTELPAGLRGFLLVGVLAAAMSSLDSTMGALSSSTLVDLLRPLRRKLGGAESSLRLSRCLVALFGLGLALVAYALKDAEGFLWLTFQIGSITYGALLGVFLLGILTQRGSDTGNAIAMLSAGALCAILLSLIRHDALPLGWSWLILVGTLWTFLIGCFWPRYP